MDLPARMRSPKRVLPQRVHHLRRDELGAQRLETALELEGAEPPRRALLDAPSVEELFSSATTWKRRVAVDRRQFEWIVG
jgi:hypothetical protein